LSTPEFSEFDVAVIGLGFHHFEDPKLAMARLAERLKAITGVLVIVDFLPFQKVGDAQSTTAQKTIKHHGFTAEEMRDFYVAAGFVDFDIVALKQKAQMEMKDGSKSERTIFVAKGRKAGSVMQRLGAWIGSMQDGVGNQLGVKGPDNGDGWNPGADEDRRGGGKTWNMVARTKAEEWDGYQESTPKKQWNGF
jgi:hypothetical protein